MRNILIHMIDNEDWIVNWVIHDKGSEYKRVEADKYADMAQVIAHLDQVESRTKEYLASIRGRENEILNRRQKFSLRSGQSFDLTVEEILFQSFTEQLYHLGELIALLWQENFEPPQMQWFYNNPRQHPK